MSVRSDVLEQFNQVVRLSRIYRSDRCPMNYRCLTWDWTRYRSPSSSVVWSPWWASTHSAQMRTLTSLSPLESSCAFMRTLCNLLPSLRDAIDVRGTSPSDRLIGATHHTNLSELLEQTTIASELETRGRSVLIASADQFVAALAMIECDGLARRITLYPPNLALEHLPYVMQKRRSRCSGV